MNQDKLQSVGSPLLKQPYQKPDIQVIKLSSVPMLQASSGAFQSKPNIPSPTPEPLEQ